MAPFLLGKVEWHLFYWHLFNAAPSSSLFAGEIPLLQRLTTASASGSNCVPAKLHAPRCLNAVDFDPDHRANSQVKFSQEERSYQEK